MNTVTVIDSIMGSGKTTWAMRQMIETEDNFLYIAPFNEETERIQEEVKNKEIFLPQNFGKGKTGNVLELLQRECDIAGTHELFKRFTPEHKQAVQDGEYVLFLDETIDAISEFKTPHRDSLRLMLDKNLIEIGDDGYIKWIDDNYDDTPFNDIRNLARNKSLVKVGANTLLWHYPIEVLKAFKKIYVFTYMFEASTLKAYFDLYKVPYEKKTIRDNELVDYFNQSRKDFIPLVELYRGDDLNNIAVDRPQALSMKWFKNSDNDKEIEQLQKHLYNYFRNKCKAKSKDILWTTFKCSKSDLRGRGYSKGYEQPFSRATNKLKDRHHLAYAANIYFKPELNRYFKKHDIELNQDEYALSVLIQWIWRSAIREKEQISIYIPSERMRKLFIDWLFNKKTEKA